MLDQAVKLRELAGQDLGKSRSKILTITSGKGGVGKSNIVINLAIELQKQGKKVLIFDADIGMGNDDVLMGVFPKHTLFDILNDEMSIDKVLVEGHMGVKLLSGGSGINRVEDLSEREREKFLDKIQELDEYDYILIDTGAGINRSVLAFISCCQELIVVTTPEPTSLTDAYSLLKATKHFKIKNKASVIVNKSLSYKEGQDTFNKFKSAIDRFLFLEIDYLGAVLEDRKLVQAVREQSPFTISYPNSDAAKCIKDIAKKLEGEVNNQTNIGANGLFKRIFSIFS
ncbi:MinD/ParA family protein [Clostridium sp. 'White wine YQ']|uniref:MinD/ParA family protein n=1 Tax=Clostridium sp. 'White wine YQ' TaxID=3027474 RepID=UPI00236637CF|nr:MinD/ParA family protein [Clostridium sp. 'White wine YQ']MDD7794584.1 MinD/ParA family protein [Clostridium sp. 'White wine YQ']